MNSKRLDSLPEICNAWAIDPEKLRAAGERLQKEWDFHEPRETITFLVAVCLELRKQLGAADAAIDAAIEILEARRLEDDEDENEGAGGEG